MAHLSTRDPLPGGGVRPYRAAMNLGQLSVVFRRERSLHGVDPRALKSALQKYARRGDEEKGLWCLVELDSFARALASIDALARRDGVTATSARRRVDALRTNTMNRLVVMLSEEVNVHDVWLPVAAREHYVRWCAKRDADAGRDELVALYRRIVAAEKCRVVSDYRTVYNLAPHYLPDDEHEALVALHQDMLRTQAPDLYRVNYAQGHEAMSADELARRALTEARSGRDEALFWCGRLVERRDAARAIVALWEGLLASGFARESIAALRFFYGAMTHREKPIYLYHAVLLVALRDRLDATRPATEPRGAMDVARLYVEHDAKPAPSLDGFVFDLHTGVRRDDGRTTFALEGAHVEGESTRARVPAYRALYVEFKRRLDGYTAKGEATPVKPQVASVAVDRSERVAVEALAEKLGVPVRALTEAREREITALPRAQKRTATMKKAVFVAPDAVFKGPYGGDDTKLTLNLTHTALVARFEAWLGLEAPTVAPWRALWKTSRGTYYLEAENLGASDGGGAWSVVSSKVETDVKVLARGSFVRRVSELEGEALTTPSRVWVTTLEHLYVLHLLGIGDEGSHNVLLAADGRVVGIDLEELRSTARAPTDALASLFKRVSAAQRALHARHLARVRTFAGPLTDAQFEAALSLGADRARLERVAERIARFNVMRSAGA